MGDISIMRVSGNETFLLRSGQWEGLSRKWALIKRVLARVCVLVALQKLLQQW